MRRSRLTAGIPGLLLCLQLAGCGEIEPWVKPYERIHLADPIMSFDRNPVSSAYSEERTEKTVGVDYLHGNSTMRASYTNSEENDYTADTVSLGVSVDMFGDLTTVTLGYSRGWDTVEKVGDPSLPSQRRIFTVACFPMRRPRTSWPGTRN
jgi:hypothetical protein